MNSRTRNMGTWPRVCRYCGKVRMYVERKFLAVWGGGWFRQSEKPSKTVLATRRPIARIWKAAPSRFDLRVVPDAFACRASTLTEASKQHLHHLQIRGLSGRLRYSITLCVRPVRLQRPVLAMGGAGSGRVHFLQKPLSFYVWSGTCFHEKRSSVTWCAYLCLLNVCLWIPAWKEV